MHFLKSARHKSKRAAALALAAAAIVSGCAAVGAARAAPGVSHSLAQNVRGHRAPAGSKHTYSDVRIRRNPINDFESLPVGRTDLKMVLTTGTDETGKTRYGVGLVDANDAFVSTWWLSDYDEKQTELNYTTDILPGKDDGTFFVLAGISDLAKALNLAYDYYDEQASVFDRVVRANPAAAPTIKVFRLRVENDAIVPPKAGDAFTFDYPTFKDSGEGFNAGLKFFIKNGLFCSTRGKSASNPDAAYYFAGYFQYLTYGQIFEYNYANDADEFALASAYMAPDPQMGNLYALWGKETGSCVPALSDVSAFFSEVLLPIIDMPRGKVYSISPYCLDKSLSYDQSIPYDIRTPSGQTVQAPREDWLSAKTAMALAFMLDYAPNVMYDSSDEASSRAQITGQPFTNVGHDRFACTPGMFVWSPTPKKAEHPLPERLSYYYFAPDPKAPQAGMAWTQVASARYDSRAKKYAFVHVGPGNASEQRRLRYYMAEYDPFDNPKRYLDAQYGYYWGSSDKNEMTEILRVDADNTGQSLGATVRIDSRGVTGAVAAANRDRHVALFCN